jgi:integrase
MAREKPALTQPEVDLVKRELVTGRRERSGPWPPWMGHCWEVAVAQGCRIKETNVPLDCVDEARGTITFPATKGNRPFTTALNPDLLPLVRERRAAGATRLADLPPNPSYWFWCLFRKLGMEGVSFHCTRVTVVSRLARAGVSQSQAMRFVGHATATVHRLYQRLGVEDLGDCLKALRGSPPPEK